MAQSRRDQLQAYRFLTKRAQAALVTGEPNALEPPMRRLTVTTISGIMIAILVTAGFGLKGLIRPVAKSDWKENGSVVIEKETGSQYVLIDGVLHPALNFTSAELASGNKNGPHVVTVSRSSLGKTTRGSTIGIAGLPDSLPSAKNLIDSPLTTCTQLRRRGVDGVAARVTINLGTQPKAATLPSDTGVIVRTPSGAQSLLFNGLRFDLSDPGVAAELGLGSATPLIVGTAFLDAVPPGAKVAAPALPGFGTTSKTVLINNEPQLIGQVLKVREDGSYRVVLDDGLGVATPIEARLLEAVSQNGGRIAERAVSSSDLGSIVSSQTWTQDPIASQLRDLPSTTPKLDQTAQHSGRLCAVYTKGSDQTPHFTVPGGAAVTGFGEVSESTASSTGVADSVVFKPGGAAIVRSAKAATVFLLADPGRKFAFASADALAALGYGDVKPDVVPDFLLATLPPGPALDPTKARTPAD